MFKFSHSSNKESHNKYYHPITKWQLLNIKETIQERNLNNSNLSKSYNCCYDKEAITSL